MFFTPAARGYQRQGRNREEIVAAQRAPRRILVALNEDVVFMIAITRAGGIEVENRGLSSPSKVTA